MKTLVIEKPDKLFFTADTHFNHENIIRYCDRPFKDVEQMNAMLISKWNKVIDHGDTVIIAGDFAYGDKLQWESLLGRLSGMKILVQGNHDRDTAIPEHKFHRKYDGFATILVKDPDGDQHITVCHYPMLSWYLSHKNAWNAFGHWHSGTVRKAEGLPGSTDTEDYVREERKAYDKLRPTQYDVGTDGNDYTPVSYYQLKKIINSQIKQIR
jgi:calcineurin-like phosphoesterase family protein